MNSKYGQLAIGILKAVQNSSQNPLEKDLLGALIDVESQPSNDFQNESVPMDSKPIKEEANGKKPDQSTSEHQCAA